jgi:hypothetical protein
LTVPEFSTATEFALAEVAVSEGAVGLVAVVLVADAVVAAEDEARELNPKKKTMGISCKCEVHWGSKYRTNPVLNGLLQLERDI